jgi:hypothetical protein
MPELQPLGQRLRNSAWLAVAEFAIVAALFYADAHHHIYVSKTPYLFLLGWASLRLRGMRWKDVGLARPQSWRKAFLVGVAVGVAMEALECLSRNHCSRDGLVRCRICRTSRAWWAI